MVNGLDPEHKFWRALHCKAPTEFLKFDEIIKIVLNLGKKSAINFKFLPKMQICTRSWLKIIIVKFVTWLMCILLTRRKNDNFCSKFCILNVFMYHLGREIDLVPPWVGLCTKISENVWQTAYTRSRRSGKLSSIDLLPNFPNLSKITKLFKSWERKMLLTSNFHHRYIFG